jgi:RNase adapter protein RapZ
LTTKPDLDRLQLILITGISGSGKSVALRLLEDDGYFCIDNLPGKFLSEIPPLMATRGIHRVAVAIDVRTDDSPEELRDHITAFSSQGHDVKVIFLNARTDTLVQRFSETRRRHPLAFRLQARDGVEPTLIESIEQERELMSLIDEVGIVLDTSDLPANTLRQWIREVVGADNRLLTLSFVSFGFKHGIPLDADLVFDARCLPNPHYAAELRHQTGLDQPVADYLRAEPAVQAMIDDINGYLHRWLPHYLREHRSYLTVAIGCTGGQHRSVYLVEEIAKRFRRQDQVLIRHRSLATRGAS